jgi:hypothetical protein
MMEAAVGCPYIKTLGVLETRRVFAFVGEARFETHAHQGGFIPLLLRPLRAFPLSAIPVPPPQIRSIRSKNPLTAPLTHPMRPNCPAPSPCGDDPCPRTGAIFAAPARNVPAPRPGPRACSTLPRLLRSVATLGWLLAALLVLI